MNQPPRVKRVRVRWRWMQVLTPLLGEDDAALCANLVDALDPKGVGAVSLGILEEAGTGQDIEEFIARTTLETLKLILAWPDDRVESFAELVPGGTWLNLARIATALRDASAKPGAAATA